MIKSLEQLISEIPEVYQTIYGHPELSNKTSRTCTDRLEKILEVYDSLSKEIGNPLKVLDLGCAQGFFTLSLAERGAIVHGIDFLESNITVCKALAQENPNLKATFEVNRIEFIISKIEPGQYDLILGFSVFHHIIYEFGFDQVRKWLSKILNIVPALVLELASNEEPLYWSSSLPKDTRYIISDASFSHELGKFKTHLSNIKRPLFYISNSFWFLDGHASKIESWTDYSHEIVRDTHQGTRRYFFSKKYFGKLYNLQNTERGSFNRSELKNEITFLSEPPKNFLAPKFLTSGFTETEGWIITDLLKGKLLSKLIAEGEPLNHLKILQSVLTQLIILEEINLFYSDLRTWNVMLLEDGSTRLIDLGSISSNPSDCGWPKDLYFSFFIFAYELLTGIIYNPDPLRTVAISPYNLPHPYSLWAKTLWEIPKENWNFKLILKILNNLDFNQNIEPEIISLKYYKSLEEGIQILSQNIRHLKMKLGETESRQVQAEAKAVQAEAKAVQAEAKAIQVETYLFSLINSYPLKILKPIKRFTAKILKISQ